MNQKSIFSLVLLLLFSLSRTFLQAQGTPVYRGDNQVINTYTISNRVDDYTEHTYGTWRASNVEYSCIITRNFSAPVKSVSLVLESGCSVNIGYVGGPYSEDTKVVVTVGSDCGGGSAVKTNVTSYIRINGNSVSFRLVAVNPCPILVGQSRVGWGTDASTNCSNARFHWMVTLQQPCNSSLAFSPTNVSCKGGSDGTATVYVNNGFPPYTYQWSNGAATQTATGLSAGTYSVLVRDDNGCTVSGSTQVFEPTSALTTTTQVTKSVTCARNDGEVSVSAAGGTVPYTYTMNGSTNTSGVFSNLAPGTYSYTAKDAKNCSVNGSITLPDVPPCQCFRATTTASGPLTFCSGGSVTLTANSGTGITYKWLKNKVAISGATNQAYIAKSSGNYQVVETNTSGCRDTSAPITVTVLPLPVASVTPQGDLNICQSRSVILQANSGTELTYQWRKGSSNITGATNMQYKATSAGTYYVVVKNSNGCSKTSAGITVTDVCNSGCNNPTISPSGSISICSGSSVTLTANAASDITYQWLKNNVPISGATAQTLVVKSSGNYRVIEQVTTTGCRDTSTATTVTVLPLPVASVTPQGDLNICLTRSVVLQANSGTGFTYQWKKGSSNIAGATGVQYKATSAGTYSVVITNSGGCKKTSAGVVVTDNCFTCNSVVKQWDASFGGSGEDVLNTSSLQQTADGGYIMGGYSRSGEGGDKTQASQGGYDFWIVKTDVRGVKQWDKRFGGSGDDALYSIQQTSDGGYILGGYSNSPMSGDKSANTKGMKDIWIIKIDAKGNKQWDADFGGSGDDELRAIRQTSDGGFILGGFSNSPNDGDKTQPSQGGLDFWIVKTSATGIKQWDKRFGGYGSDNMYALAQTSDGGYIFGGISYSGIGGDKTQENKGETDFWVVKTDASGNKLWDKGYGGSESEAIYSLVQTTDGGYIFAGYSFSGIGGDKTEASRGNNDYWIVKTDINGNKQWDKTYGGSGLEYLYQIKQTYDGGYTLGGGTSTSDISGDITQPSRGGGGDFWIVKIDGKGIKQWDARYGGNGVDGLFALNQTSDGGFILGGQSTSGISGDKTQNNRGEADFWLVKLGCSSVSVCNTIVKNWDVTFGGSNEDVLIASSLQQTADGGYIMGGYSSSGISGDRTQASQGGYDFWIVKTDVRGIKQWDKRFGGTGDDQNWSLQQTTDGGYILGGNSNSGISGDKTQNSQGGNDYWIVKIDANGVKQWDKRFGGSGNDELRSLQQTTDGGYVLGGLSGSGISGDKTEANRGIHDYWIVKVDANGVKQWDASFGGSGNEYLYAVRQTMDGGYILGGLSSSGISGDKTGASRGMEDFWAVKINSAGVKQWDATFGGNSNERITSLQQTIDGGYILGGWSDSNISGDKTQNSQGLYDYWIVKADANGVKKWDARFGGSGDDHLWSLQQTADGGYILGGVSQSGISGDKTQHNKGMQDYWIVKVDANGLKQWDADFGGSGIETGFALDQTSDGGFVLGGQSTSGISGDKTQANRGEADFWIVKLGCSSASITNAPKQQSVVQSNSSKEVIMPAPAKDVVVSTAQLLLYPNPSNGSISLLYNSHNAGKIQLNVYDISGRVVFNKTEVAIKGTNQYQLNLSNVASGVYNLQLIHGYDKKQAKLSIQK